MKQFTEETATRNVLIGACIGALAIIIYLTLKFIA